MGFGIGEDGENIFHQCERDHYSIQLIEWSRIGLRKGTEVDLPDCLGGLGGAWGVTEKHSSSQTNSGKGRDNRGRKIMYVHNLGFTKLPSRKLHLVNSTIFH